MPMFASLEALVQDLRYGARMLGRNPGFAAVAAITLALGIGANTTIFSAMNALVLRPLRLEQPDRLVTVFEVSAKQGGERWPTRASTLAWHKFSRTFQAIERGDLGGSPANLTGMGRAERVSVAYCTPGYLAMLGARPYQGRTFLPEDGPGESTTTVISAEAWHRTFAGDPDILGKSVVIEGKAYTIVGILPAGFSITPWNMKVDAWIANAQSLASDTRWMPAIGRLKPGVTIEQAQAELNGLAKGQAGADPGWTVRVEPLHKSLTGGTRKLFWLLFSAVGFVLLIACVNVANLLLARAAARQKEIAVRVSLGAGRWRLMRQLLAESTLLALAGGALGVAVGLAGNKYFLRLIPVSTGPDFPIPVDFRVLGFNLALSLATGVVFGLMPAVRASRPDLHACLKEGHGQATGGSQRSQSVLLVVETALAMMLLVGAGMLISSFMRLRNVELGFNPAKVLRADVKLAGTKYVRQTKTIMKEVTPESDAYFQQLLERVRAIPGVRAVGISHLAPPGDVQMRSLRVIGRPGAGEKQELSALFNEAGGEYFQSLEIPLRKGRYVNDRDAEGSPWVVNINETMAKRYFPNEEPLGQMIQVRIQGGATGVNPEEDRPRQIVGVVGDVRHFGAGSEMQPVMYASYRQHVTAYPGGAPVEEHHGADGGRSDGHRQCVAEGRGGGGPGPAAVRNPDPGAGSG